MKFEQAFVNGTEFFNVECRVVDAPWRGRRFLLVICQAPKRSEEIAIGDQTGIKQLRVEEVAVQWCELKQLRMLWISENLPENA